MRSLNDWDVFRTVSVRRQQARWIAGTIRLYERRWGRRMATLGGRRLCPWCRGSGPSTGADRVCTTGNKRNISLGQRSRQHLAAAISRASSSSAFGSGLIESNNFESGASITRSRRAGQLFKAVVAAPFVGRACARPKVLSHETGERGRGPFRAFACFIQR